MLKYSQTETWSNTAKQKKSKNTAKIKNAKIQQNQNMLRSESVLFLLLEVFDTKLF
jgi:hypothetical protein